MFGRILCVSDNMGSRLLCFITIQKNFCGRMTRIHWNSILIIYDFLSRYDRCTFVSRGSFVSFLLSSPNIQLKVKPYSDNTIRRVYVFGCKCLLSFAIYICRQNEFVYLGSAFGRTLNWKQSSMIGFDNIIVCEWYCSYNHVCLVIREPIDPSFVQWKIGWRINDWVVCNVRTVILLP